MTARPALHLVPETGEALECAGCAEREQKIVGLKTTVDLQAHRMGNLMKRLEDGGDPARNPSNSEIVAVIELWKDKTNHPKARITEDRIKLVKKRLKEYTFEEIRLAIDGLAAYPYRHFNERRQSPPGQRDDQLSVALKSGEALEKFAVLGHRALKEAV